jgi:hypothetical protein
MIFVPHRNEVSTACFSDSFTFYYVDKVRASQKTQAFTVTGIALLFSVDEVRTSQKTQAFTACYRDSLTFSVDEFHTSQKTSLHCLLEVSLYFLFLLYILLSYAELLRLPDPLARCDEVK